jgi:O-antigen ligase
LATAVFALIQHLAAEGHVYWLRPQSQATSWYGPFVNHSHFAGYLALLLPLPIALMMNKFVRSEERFLLGFAAVVMGLSVVVSLSRGGMIALASELLFLVVAGSRHFRRLSARSDHNSTGRPAAGPGWRSLAALGLVVGSIGASVLWLGPERLADRIVRGNPGPNGRGESFYESRGWIWRDSLRVFQAHPFFGVGMGAFETAFPMYSKSDGSLLVSQAHNDYLQVLTDCGVLGGILVVWFIAAIGIAVYRGLCSRDPFQRSLALGCGAAIFGMLVHSLFDFNLQVPSTALLFLLICAIASVAGGQIHQKKANAG